MNYECKVETKSPIRRQLTISVKPESIQEYIDQQFVTLQKTAKLPGFRPGKVPLDLLRKQYMADVKSDAFSKIVRDSYIQALEDNKINAIGNPQFETKSGAQLNTGETLTFVATVEIYPEIKIGDLSKLKVERPSSEMTDEDMEESLQNLREAHSSLVPHEDYHGPAKTEDLVEVSFEGTLDGEKHEGMEGKNRLVKIGAKAYLPDFEDALIGMKKGEEKSFQLNFPADYGNKQMAGKAADFKVTLHEFKKEQLPELNDEFAKNFKVESILELRKKMAEHLTENKQREARAGLRNNLTQALLQAHDFEVPEHFVESQMEFLMQDAVNNLTQRGFTKKMVDEYLQKDRETFHKRATDQVRVSLILDKIGQEQNIRVDAQDLEREYAAIAQAENLSVDQVRDYFKDEQAQRQLRFKVKEDRIVEYVLSQVQVVEGKTESKKGSKKKK